MATKKLGSSKKPPVSRVTGSGIHSMATRGDLLPEERQEAWKERPATDWRVQEQQEMEKRRREDETESA